MPERSINKSNCPNLETSAVWEEAGFIPPAFCRTLIEFLHRLYNDDIENIYDIDILRDQICVTGEKTISGCSEYIFTDRERMYHFADEMNIPAGEMNDAEIADEIICRLIDEYTGDKFAFTDRSGIMEVLYKITTCIA